MGFIFLRVSLSFFKIQTLTGTTIFLLVVSFLGSLLLAYFQYYFRKKNQPQYVLFLFCLKAIALWLLFVLLINPKITATSTTILKPTLHVLVDNSKSIRYFGEEQSIKEVLQQFTTNGELNDKFTIQTYAFGNGILTNDSLNFKEENTNIHKALQTIQSISNDAKGAIVLLSDGNQTAGLNYEYSNYALPIYPIVFGDTTKFTDIRIDQLNTNQYSFLKNSFPVEILSSYEGKERVSTLLTIRKNNKLIFKKPLVFSKDNSAQTITTNIESNTIGTHFYEVDIQPIANEKNTVNNKKRFSIEVINEQTKVAIVSSMTHPDIGALKRAIESNKQRKVTLIDPKKNDVQWDDYRLLILYQPNRDYKSVMEEIQKKNLNFILISGLNTDWDVINQTPFGVQKQVIASDESYLADYNPNFFEFFQEDIGFNNLPPLKDKFGKLSLEKKNQTFLFQNINGISTSQPLISVLNEEDQKAILVFGEGIWQWRAAIYRKNNSFKEFDQFVNTLIQYSHKKEEKNRLTIDYSPTYTANSKINIKALFYDNAYKFDPRVSLQILLTEIASDKKSILPFSLRNNRYEVELDNLAAGDYSFEITVLNEGISKKGKFKILEYSIEEQFSSSNYTALEQLALNSKGKPFLKSEILSLSDELLTNKSLYQIEKTEKSSKELIHWSWLLFVVVSFLAVEWFTRKYFGKI